MKTIASWNDLRPYGIDLLTGEACGLMYRYLCDVTERGRKILERWLSVPELRLSEAWNRGEVSDPHVGSILLAPEMLSGIAVFALLESGCTECWMYKNGSVVGVELTDTPERIELARRMCPEGLARRFAYRGTAGDRNVHVISGRVQ